MTYFMSVLYRFLLLSFLWLMTTSAFAEAANLSTTQVRYASLYRALEPGLVISGFDRLLARQRIVSRSADVLPSQIEVRILTKAGVVVVKVASDGTVNFPMTQVLLDENPVVESNQTKGSLSLSATMEIKLGKNKVVPYADLYESAMQAQTALPLLGASMSGRSVRSIEFEFDRSLGARAELSDSKADELFVADPNGLLILRIDSALAKRNAHVTFSDIPIAARPHID